MTDLQLKQALATMLPDTIMWDEIDGWEWYKGEHAGEELRDTELLKLCWDVEEIVAQTIGWSVYLVQLWHITSDLPSGDQCCDYGSPMSIWLSSHATWQQRVSALAKVKLKGIEP